MIDAWLKECPYLAPYLKEKLAADKKHTWRDAPYIHEDVREALAEDEPRPSYVRPEYAMPSYNPRLGYVPPYTGGGGAATYSMATATLYADDKVMEMISRPIIDVDAQIRKLESEIDACQQQLKSQMVLSMINAKRDIWEF